MMRPLVFGDCAGWLHEAGGALGVVVCAPQGYEQLCAQGALRELAERLAARGLPTLRFDYPGCGDSLGDDEGPARLEVWRASVAPAVAALREATGVKSVALVGLRLGGALALQAATSIDDIAAVALLAPVVSGRAYRREIAAFAAMTGGEADAEGAISVAGFRSTADTLAALDRLDATQIETAPPAIFLAAPAEQPGADKLATRLAALGAEVTRAPFEGYAELLARARRSVRRTCGLARRPRPRRCAIPRRRIGAGLSARAGLRRHAADVRRGAPRRRALRAGGRLPPARDPLP
jgi:pimeloyl-ACP methyl ester carboxylesterase